MPEEEGREALKPMISLLPADPLSGNKYIRLIYPKNYSLPTPSARSVIISVSIIRRIIVTPALIGIISSFWRPVTAVIIPSVISIINLPSPIIITSVISSPNTPVSLRYTIIAGGLILTRGPVDVPDSRSRVIAAVIIIISIG